MKYYLIAGEASGDLHAANLMKALLKEDAKATFRCWGGDLMESAGGNLVKHYKELAFMGFWEVIKNLNTISKNLDFCKKDIAVYQPDVLILVDYSGFNLRIAQWAKTAGWKVFYYISPQVWASRQSRVKKIKLKHFSRKLKIFPLTLSRGGKPFINWITMHFKLNLFAMKNLSLPSYRVVVNKK